MIRPSVSIVMTYYERSSQLNKTLKSFVYHGYGSDVEVIIVDDGSTKDKAKTPDFPFLFSLKIIYLPSQKKWYSNPCIPFNVGMAESNSNIIIIQNAECLHYNNIVENAKLKATDDIYLSCSCYSLDEKSTENFVFDKKNMNYVTSLMKESIVPVVDGASGWYNHSEYRPVGYHFCSVITRNNILRLKGFDEKYACGIGYDDNEFLERIRRLPLKIIIDDDAVVLHQFHYTDRIIDHQYKELYHRNWVLYNLYTKNGGKIFDYLYFLVYMFFKQKLKKKHIAKILKIIYPRFRNIR